MKAQAIHSNSRRFPITRSTLLQSARLMIMSCRWEARVIMTNFNNKWSTKWFLSHKFKNLCRKHIKTFWRKTTKSTKSRRPSTKAKMNKNLSQWSIHNLPRFSSRMKIKSENFCHHFLVPLVRLLTNFFGEYPPLSILFKCV